MADLKRLEDALRQADAAGDTASATALANEIRRLRQPSLAQDVGMSAASGLEKGVVGLAGAPGDNANLMERGLSWLFGIDPQTIATMNAAKRAVGIGSLPTTADLQAPIRKMTADESGESFIDYQPSTELGQLTQTASSIAPSALLGPGTIPTRIASVAGATAGDELARATTEGTVYEPWARTAGMILGGGAAATGAEFLTRPTPQGMPRAAASILKSAAPDDIGSFSQLGPDAMVLDASPSMTGLAGGTVTRPGQASNRLVDALAQREAGRSERLNADMQASFGRPRDMQLRKQAVMEQASRKAAPLYADRIANAPQLPTTVDDLLSIGMTNPAESLSLSRRAGLKSLFDKVDDALVAGDPKITASRLWDLRKELDSRIAWDKADAMGLSSADRAMQSVYKDVRKQIDDVLKNRLGFDAPDALIAQAKRGTEDLDYGYNVLDGGKSAISPERNAIEMGKRNPQRVQEGTTAAIGNAVGTQANDLAALKSKIGGDHGWNRAKLEQIYGKEKVDRAVAAIEREQTFARNSGDIRRNSMTAQRQSAERLLEGTDAPTFRADTTLTGLGLKGMSKVTNALLRPIVRNIGNRNRDAIAKALMTKGPQAVQLLDELSRMGSLPQTAIIRALLSAAGGR